MDPYNILQLKSNWANSLWWTAGAQRIIAKWIYVIARVR